jgi:hypothetical protein
MLYDERIEFQKNSDKPTYADGLNNQALVLENLAEHSEAIKYYVDAIDIKSPFAEAW